MGAEWSSGRKCETGVYKHSFGRRKSGGFRRKGDTRYKLGELVGTVTYPSSACIRSQLPYTQNRERAKASIMQPRCMHLHCTQTKCNTDGISVQHYAPIGEILNGEGRGIFP